MTTRLDDFEFRIAQTVARADEARVEEMQELTTEMEQRLHMQAAFERLADRLHREELRPRVEAVARHFEGARLQHMKTLTGTFSTCTFPHSERFPASTTLTMGVTFDPATLKAGISYDLQIIPVLMEFEGRDDFPVLLEAPDTDAVVAWVERKLQAFVETYLRLERDPRYRLGARHTDPVCGMVVHGGAVPHRTEHERRVFHFCSAACRQRFEANPAFYLGREGVPVEDAMALVDAG